MTPMRCANLCKGPSAPRRKAEHLQECSRSAPATIQKRLRTWAGLMPHFAGQIHVCGHRSDFFSDPVVARKPFDSRHGSTEPCRAAGRHTRKRALRRITFEDELYK